MSSPKNMDIFGVLKSFATRVRKLQVDNHVFRLHYRFTVVILFTFSMLVTSKQYFGDPIDCTSSTSTVRPNLIDQYCWVSSTITVPHACHKKVGKEVAHPCVSSWVDEKDEVVYHQYYQWVCFVLFFQGIMFYLPHYLWKCWESGRLRALTADLDGPLVGKDVKEQRILAIDSYFKVSLRNHKFYTLRYTFCEILNLVNVVGQMFLTNRFLGGTFIDYGTKVVRFSQTDQMNRTDPMVMAFPRVTQCRFYIYGSGGNIVNNDAVCVLPVNIINEKIYIFLWFWFIILAVSSALAVVYRVACIFLPALRYYLLKSKATSVDDEHINTIVRGVDFGDWFLLYLLAKNINSYNFQAVASVIVKQLRPPITIPIITTNTTPEEKKLPV